MGCTSSKVSPRASPKVESSNFPPDASPDVSAVAQDIIQAATPFVSVIMGGINTAAAFAPVPWLSPAVSLLGDIIKLCAAVPQNKNAATCLSNKCHKLHDALQQYEKKSLPEHMVQHRDKIFECLNQVKSKMQNWSEKSWLDMFFHQGNFGADFADCVTEINDCLQIFGVAVQFDIQAQQKEIQENLNADRNAILEQLADVNFAQRVIEGMVRESRDDIKVILAMLQTGLAKHEIVPDEGRKRMAQNLYKLLKLSNLAPPECQLNSGEVEWAGEVPIEGGTKNADMYKGRYLQSEDVRIKVIRSVDMKNENTVKRTRREVKLWADIYAIDKGKHVLPFYGFFSPDGIRLGLVSPWIERGNALEYVKANNNSINYRKMILGIAKGIKVLHSMKPPIIHGNLRAENVLVGDECQPLIADFALAKLEGESITLTTGLSESCRWCAPEVFEPNPPVSTKGDVYSFGMTILELYTHEMPYANLKTLQVYLKKVEGDGLPDRPQDRRVIERGLDDRMWVLLCTCWSRDPDDRPLIGELLGPAEDEKDARHKGELCL